MYLSAKKGGQYCHDRDRKDKAHCHDKDKSAAPACDRCWVSEQTGQKNLSYHEGGARSSITKTYTGAEEGEVSDLAECSLNVHKKRLRPSPV